MVSATRKVDDSYANGYGNSKWGGEVLLREANEQFGLPVSVFRCDMILADTSYAGQLNLPDMFTRMMLSLVATGVAPHSFYELDADGNRQRAHYDGLPVEFIAEAISTLGVHVHEGFETYHVMNPYDDGIGMDQFVDWLVEAGYPIRRVDAYADWLQRFETTLRALPEKQRNASLLPLLHNYQSPGAPDQRVDRPDRPVPGGGAGREDRAGQGHPAHLRAGDRQVHHRPGAARPAVGPPLTSGLTDGARRELLSLSTIALSQLAASLDEDRDQQHHSEGDDADQRHHESVDAYGLAHGHSEGLLDQPEACVVDVVQAHGAGADGDHDQ